MPSRKQMPREPSLQSLAVHRLDKSVPCESHTKNFCLLSGNLIFCKLITRQHQYIRSYVHSSNSKVLAGPHSVGIIQRQKRPTQCTQPTFHQSTHTLPPIAHQTVMLQRWHYSNREKNEFHGDNNVNVY